MKSERGTSALLLGYYGANNLGDDLMLAAILPILGSQGLDVTVVSENPALTSSTFDVKCVKNVPLCLQWGFWGSLKSGIYFKLISAILKTDVLVVGGGDLVRDDLGWKTFLYTIEKALLYLLFHRRLYFINIGITRPRTRYGRAILQYVFKRSRKIFVRDRSSHTVVEELAPTAAASLIPDIVTAIEFERTDRSAEEESGKYIVVSLRGRPNDFNQYPFEDEHIDAMAEILDRVAESTGMAIHFVPFHGTGPRNDNLLHEKISDRMVWRNSVVMHEWTSDVDTLLSTISGSTAVIGMRLHSIVLAVALGRKCVALPYDNKINEYSNLVNLTTRLTSDELLNVQKSVLAIQDCIDSPTDYMIDLVEKWHEVELD